ncbi:MAG: DUF6263 family protein [Phycisphaerales bacterium]
MLKEQNRRAFVVAAACVASLAFCSGAGAATQLTLKLDKGKTYYERLAIDRRITQSAMGIEQVTDEAIGVGRKLNVLDVDAEGNMQIQCTYIWSRFKQSGPMGIVDYDSSLETVVPGGAEGFAALMGESYTIRLSPRGAVLDVNGVQELAKDVRKKVPEELDISSAVSPVAFLLSEDGVQETTESFLTVRPDQPVDQGVSWEKRTRTVQGAPMIVQSKWTLKKLWMGVATITSTSSIKSDPAAPPLEVQGTRMKIDLSGTAEGTTEMDETTGLIKTASTQSLLKGQIGIATSPDGPFDTMTIPITFETTTTLEMSDRKLDMSSR